MGYFKNERTIERVYLADKKYWVEVHTDVTWKEGKNFITPDENGNPSIKANVSDYLAALIVDWNLDDENGNKVPITPESIDKLNSPDAAKLVMAAGNGTGKKASEKKSSSKN
jgi:hypothetical protein